MTEERKKVVMPFPQHPDGDAADEQGFGNRLDQLGESAPRNQARQTLYRVEPTKVRVERLEREIPASQDERREQSSGHQQKEKRSKSHQGIERQVGKAQHQELRFANQLLLERQPTPQDRRHPLQHPRTGKPESPRGNHQNQKSADLARAGNLPFFAGLLQASG